MSVTSKKRKSSQPEAPRAAERFTLDPRWMAGILLLLALVVYWPALGADFIWDDNGHVTAPHLVSLAGLERIWFDVGATQQYYPLLHSAFWLEYHLWGDATLGYHLVNVVQHALAAWLFGMLLRRLSVPGAWFAACLFALHPVCVESVAWVTEQKNTLSTVFYLSAALAYLRFEQERRPGRYVLATFLFVLALLSKTVTASLPAALLVILWWSRGRLDWRKDVWPLLPWFALSLGFGALSAWVEHTLIGAQGADYALSALQRTLLAGRVVWFYLGKLVWPANLIFIYPRWTIDVNDVAEYLPLLAAVAALAIGFWAKRYSRAPLAAMLLFGGSLFPVLGFVNVYPFKFSYVADHFQYLASLAVFALVAASLAKVTAPLPRWLTGGAWLGLGLTLGLVTWQQTEIYEDPYTLYQTTLERNPDCWMAHANLGVAYYQSGHVEEALREVNASLLMHPDSAEAENNCGSYLSRLGHPKEAIAHFERALQLQPRFPAALNNLGLAYAARGDFSRAITTLESALKIERRSPVTHCNLGVALTRSGQLEEAIGHFQEAVHLDPNYADAEFKWAAALMVNNRFPEAIVHFERSLRLEPNSFENQTLYARALAENGHLAGAIPHFRKALQLNLDSSEAHKNLAIALRDSGDAKEAATHFEEAARLERKSAK